MAHSVKYSAHLLCSRLHLDSATGVNKLLKAPSSIPDWVISLHSLLRSQSKFVATHQIRSMLAALAVST